MSLTLAHIMASAGIDPNDALVIRHAYIREHEDGTAGIHGDSSPAEIMVVTPTIQKYIEEARISEMYDAISEGGFWGMQTTNQALDRLFRQGVITEEMALANAGNLTELRQMLRRKEA